MSCRMIEDFPTPSKKTVNDTTEKEKENPCNQLKRDEPYVPGEKTSGRR
jgi:hypothetical protein